MPLLIIIIPIIIIAIIKSINEKKYRELEAEVLKKLGFLNWDIVSYIDETVIVKSRQTLEKYDLNEEIKTIILEQDQIKDIEFTNELKKGQIRIIKVDLYNNEVKLKGVEFNLLDESGNVIEKLIFCIFFFWKKSL